MNTIQSIAKLFTVPKLLSALLAIACSLPVMSQERPAFTEEQLAMLRIRPVPGKPDLYLLPGFDGSMSGGNVVVLETDEGVMVVDTKFSYSL